MDSKHNAPLWMGLAFSVVLGVGSAAIGQERSARPVFSGDGTSHVPAFDLPPSQLSSREAQEGLKARVRATGGGDAIPRSGTIADARAANDRAVAPMVEAMRSLHPLTVEERTMAGVPVRVFMPKSGKADPRRVLINLHGGAFMMCADSCATLESQPIAALGGFKVISVNYREGPEDVFPAASQDVAAVYKELLKTYKPKQIGIYGCSAGGALTAQVAAWLPAHGLPQAGAIGIFGSGGTRAGTGDSAYLSGYIDGSFAPPPKPGTTVPPSVFRSYFEGSNPADPMISPANHLDVLAKFPPTLVITGTRAPDLSPAAYTHSQLVKAGVPGDLIVGEGLGHCYMYQANLPEAHDAWETIIRFFRKNLG